MKCGFYEREITPPIGDDIPGYSGPIYPDDVFGTTVYPAQLPSSPLVPEAGQMIADFALEIAKEVL